MEINKIWDIRLKSIKVMFKIKDTDRAEEMTRQIQQLINERDKIEQELTAARREVKRRDNRIKSIHGMYDVAEKKFTEKIETLEDELVDKEKEINKQVNYISKLEGNIKIDTLIIPLVRIFVNIFLQTDKIVKVFVKKVLLLDKH